MSKYQVAVVSVLVGLVVGSLFGHHVTKWMYQSHEQARKEILFQQTQEKDWEQMTEDSKNWAQIM